MFYPTRASALSAALRAIDRTADPDRLLDAARAAGITLPIEAARVTSPRLGQRSMGRGGLAFTVPTQRHDELAKAVDALVSKGAKAA